MINVWSLWLVIVAVLSSPQRAASQQGELKLAAIIGLLHGKKGTWPNLQCAVFIISVFLGFSAPATETVAKLSTGRKRAENTP